MNASKRQIILDSIGSIMRVPITVERDSSLFDVLHKMLDNGISRLFVKDEGGKISSVIAEKDALHFLFNDDTERTLRDVPIAGIARPLISVKQDTSISGCARMMMENMTGSVAVSDDAGDIAGIATKTDLAKYYAERRPGRERLVGEYMSPYYAWMHADATLSDIVPRMIEDKITRLILRNAGEEPAGIVSMRDLFRVSLTHGEIGHVTDSSNPEIPIVFSRKGFLSKTGFGGTIRASDIMRDEIITVSYDDILADAAGALIERRINGAGVLSLGGALIGIISKTDITRALSFL